MTAAIPTFNRGALSHEKRSDRLRVMSSTWQLDVFADGSGAEYVDRAAMARAHALRAAPQNAPTAATLEAAGRRFIARTLSKVIVLHPGERLVPEASAARTETDVRTDGTRRTDAVVANRIVFTREIDGLPVVGAGSKVTITFLNDGSLESFRYDWPAYAKTRRLQAPVPSREIYGRLQRVMNVRAEVAPTRPIGMPATSSAIASLPLSTSTRLERLACGYYDPGFGSRDPRAPVQIGCYYHILHYQGAGNLITAAGYSGAVPAAIIAETDAYWPEAMLLQNLHLRGLPAAPNAHPGAITVPVPSKHR